MDSIWCDNDIKYKFQRWAKWANGPNRAMLIRTLSKKRPNMASTDIRIIRACVCFMQQWTRIKNWRSHLNKWWKWMLTLLIHCSICTKSIFWHTLSLALSFTHSTTEKRVNGVEQKCNDVVLRCHFSCSSSCS